MGKESKYSLEEILVKSEPPLTQGSCILRRPEIAEIVQKALLYFEGKRYHLNSWCIMPNHVHLVITPSGNNSISEILYSLKSFSFQKINKILHSKGPLWERESFDHLIRSPEHREYFVKYTENNPVKAGFCQNPKEWPFSSCGAGFQPAPDIEFINPQTTPFADIKTRGELPHLYKEGGTYFITFRLIDSVAYRKKI